MNRTRNSLLLTLSAAICFLLCLFGGSSEASNLYRGGSQIVLVSQGEGYFVGRNHDLSSTFQKVYPRDRQVTHGLVGDLWRSFDAYKHPCGVIPILHRIQVSILPPCTRSKVQRNVDFRWHRGGSVAEVHHGHVVGSDQSPSAPLVVSISRSLRSLENEHTVPVTFYRWRACRACLGSGTDLGTCDHHVRDATLSNLTAEEGLQQCTNDLQATDATPPSPTKQVPQCSFCDGKGFLSFARDGMKDNDVPEPVQSANGPSTTAVGAKYVFNSVNSVVMRQCGCGRLASLLATCSGPLKPLGGGTADSSVVVEHVGSISDVLNVLAFAGRAPRPQSIGISLFSNGSLTHSQFSSRRIPDIHLTTPSETPAKPIPCALIRALLSWDIARPLRLRPADASVPNQPIFLTPGVLGKNSRAAMAGICICTRHGSPGWPPRLFDPFHHHRWGLQRQGQPEPLQEDPKQGGQMSLTYTCPVCGGHGNRIRGEEICPVCGGRRVMLEKVIRNVTIPAGAFPGPIARFPEEGHQQPLQTAPGDVIVNLETPDQFGWSRSGTSLQTLVVLTLDEAVDGFTRHLQHPDGHYLTIRRAGGTKPGSVLEVPGMGLPVPGMPAAGARGCPCNGNNTTPIGPYAHVHHRNDLDSQPTMAAATVHPTSVSYQYCAFRSKGIPVKKRVPPIPKLKQCNSMCPVPSLTDLAVTSNELKLSNDSFLVYANGTLGVWGTPDILDEVAIFHQCHQYQEAGGSQQHPTTVTQQACSAVKHEPLPLGKSMKPCAGLLTVWSALDARTVVGASPCGWLQILSDEDMVLPPAGHSNGSFVYESSPGNHAFSNNKFRVGHKKFSPQPPPADSLMHFKQRAFETASAKGMKCSWLQQQGASMRGNLEIQFEVTIPEDL